MFHKFDFCGWYDGQTEQETARCTTVAPSAIPAAPVHGEPYPNFTGYAWVDLIYPGEASVIEQEA